MNEDRAPVISGDQVLWSAPEDERRGRTYPGLGHTVSSAEVDDLAEFLAARVVPAP